jgi:GNAT superfamily N-acetyltransferase
VVLADGSLARIRAIRSDDTPRLQEFHEGLSEETIYKRFFGTHPHLRPEEAERFTHVDYHDRLALVAEVGDELVGVARYDRPPGGDQAEVAFVVADHLQGHGVGTLLLEHLAAAARRRGVAAFAAETLGTNHPMQEVFHRAGFPARQRISAGIAQVRFPIAPTDAYLSAVLQRDAASTYARLHPVVLTAGAGGVGIVCQSETGASNVVEECRRLGLQPSAVLVAEALGVDLGDLLAYVAADDQTKVVLVHSDLLRSPACTVAHVRVLGRHKPVLVAAPGAWSANLCTQGGAEAVEDLPEVVNRGAERLAQCHAGTWQPPDRGVLVDLGGCNVTRARAVLDRAASGTDDPHGVSCLDPETVSDLLVAYGIAGPDGDRSVAPPAAALTIDDEGGSATARAGRRPGGMVRMLPLTDKDVAELLTAGADAADSGLAAPGLAEPVVRLARLMDDQMDICRIEAAVGQGVALDIRIWTTAQFRQRPDDPFVRRLPPAPETRMEAP